MTDVFLPRSKLDLLLQYLLQQGYRILGPQLRDSAIVYAPLSSADELPVGVRDEQRPGHYRTQQIDDGRCFAWAAPISSVKREFFAPEACLWHYVAEGPETIRPEPRKTAIFGIRPCDLAGLALQDQHFMATGNEDSDYATRRDGTFLIAVNCTHPAETCFCGSTGDGPSISSGADWILDELEDGFLLHTDSALGESLLEGLSTEPVKPAHRLERDQDRLRAAGRQRRHLPSTAFLSLLPQRHDASAWEQVAAQCLSCGNCTAVCPSCFCHRHEERATPQGQSHWRVWGSCFMWEHSHMAGHTVRSNPVHRYRQWMTHKLADWQDQYGRIGCTGCGRCISACPVGIDFVAVATALVEEGE